MSHVEIQRHSSGPYSLAMCANLKLTSVYLAQIYRFYRSSMNFEGGILVALFRMKATREHKLPTTGGGLRNLKSTQPQPFLGSNYPYYLMKVRELPGSQAPVTKSHREETLQTII